jgi:hypothetical protein
MWSTAVFSGASRSPRGAKHCRHFLPQGLGMAAFTNRLLMLRGPKGLEPPTF